MDAIKQCIGSDYSDMIELLNGTLDEPALLRMMLTPFTSNKLLDDIDLTKITENLQNFGFMPILMRKNDNGFYDFGTVYDSVSVHYYDDTNEKVESSNSGCSNIAISYTQHPEKRGKNSMSTLLKQSCSKTLDKIGNFFEKPTISVWFDKLAIKQSEKAQMYWAITSNIMFLTLPVLSLAPRYDHYDEHINSIAHAQRLKQAGMYEILLAHTKRISRCTICWTKTHLACIKEHKKDYNKNTMAKGGLWIDGWLRCWPDIERRLGALHKGTYVSIDDYLLVLDTYMLISNIAKELFSDTDNTDTTKQKDIGWLIELAWLQNVTSERIQNIDISNILDCNINIDNNAWCDKCIEKLKEDVNISIRGKTSDMHNKHWNSAIQLLEAMRESIKYLTPLLDDTACCNNNCHFNKALNAYGKFNNSNNFGSTHPEPNKLYLELLTEYKNAKYINYSQLYGVISYIAYGAPVKAHCYREGDKIGAVIALMNLPILANFIDKINDDTNIYKQLIMQKVPIEENMNIWFTGLDYRNILPIQLYKPKGIYNHVTITSIDTKYTCWLGSLQTDIEQIALGEFLHDIGVLDPECTKNIIKRAQYETLRETNVVGYIYVLQNSSSTSLIEQKSLKCPCCISSVDNDPWIPYNMYASINPVANMTLAENNIGGKWHNSKLVVYDNDGSNRIIGHGQASISGMKQEIVKCSGGKHTLVKAVVSFKDFYSNLALIKFEQCTIEQNALLRKKPLHTNAANHITVANNTCIYSNYSNLSIEDEACISIQS
jgi:hypothetical protein